jgi:hypothetical protein
MNRCAATTGFFVLGRCGSPSVTVCRCGRPVCSAHVDAQGLCPECSGAAGYADPYRPGWAHGYRRSYYGSSSYGYNTFDSYDRGGFDQGDGFEAGSGDFGTGGDVGGGSGDDGNDWVDS